MQSFISSKKRSSWLRDIGYLAAFLTVFYSLFLGHYALFIPDEGRYAEIAREMTVSHDYITPRVNGMIFLDKPIFYYWLQAISIHLFGIKEWAVRLMPALIGIGTCLMTYIAGRHLFNRQTGLLSAMILGTSPLYFGAAHYANLDCEVAAFISICLLFFMMGIKEENQKKRCYFLLGAYLFAGMAALTKGLIGIILPIAVIFSWIILTRNWRLFKNIYLIPGILLFLAVTLPWYTLVQLKNPPFFHYFFVNQHFSRFLSTQSFNNSTVWWFYIPIVFLGFCPWIIFFIAALKNNIQLFLLLWIGIIFTFFSIPQAKIVSYILPIFPALALITGHYLASKITAIKRPALLLFIMSYIVMTIGAFLLLFYLYYYQPFEILASLHSYLMIISIIFLISALVSFYLLLKNPSLFALILICMTTNMAFLITLTHGANYLNINSAKPLINKLKLIKKPSDEIISYYKYYYDVPFYLEQTIQVVADWQDNAIQTKDNWRRELWYGKLFEPYITHPQLLDETIFWEHFNNDNNKRVFVFLNENYLDQFKSRAVRYFYLGKNNDILLFSNQPIIE